MYGHLLEPERNYAHPQHERTFPRQLLELRYDMPSENLLILTLGLASTWFLKDTSLATFQIDKRKIDQYEQRFESVDDNMDHMRFIVNAARTLNPKINIILTVSPVPLSLDTDRSRGQRLPL